MRYKFRAKNKDSGKWEYGYYVKYIKRQVSPIGDFLDESDVVHLIFQSGFADWNMERPLNAVEVIEETVGQFTGLRDKVYTEIYTDDIIEYTIKITYTKDKSQTFVENGIIKHDIKNGCFSIVTEDSVKRLTYNTIKQYNIKVIDNIHDKENK
jgi:hypothetical protein